MFPIKLNRWYRFRCGAIARSFENQKDFIVLVSKVDKRTFYYHIYRNTGKHFYHNEDFDVVEELYV